MQSSISKSRQSSIISEKPGYLSEKIENFDEFQLPKSLIIFAEILHTLLLKNVYKRLFGIFFLFRSWVIN